jgi:hypothetical protein
LRRNQLIGLFWKGFEDLVMAQSKLKVLTKPLMYNFGKLSDEDLELKDGPLKWILTNIIWTFGELKRLR